MATTDKKIPEDVIKDLQLNSLYDDFFSKTGKSTFDSACNALDKHSTNHKDLKQLCTKFVDFLEKISKLNNRSERNNHCDYLTYWLYEEIGKIYKDHSSKINTVQFVKDLINVGSEVNNTKIKSNTCTIKTDNNVSLEDWKKRKISYIYFKNFENIHTISTSKKEDDCAKYLTYLESFKPLYEAYKNDLCSYFIFAPAGPDYFPCSYKYDLKNLMSGLKNCKEGKEPYPKPPVASKLTTVRSGSGTTAGQTGLKGSPGSVGTGGTARTTSTTALPSQARATSLAGAPQARAGGALTIPSAGAPQLAQGPSGSADLTRVTGDTLSALPGVVAPPSGFSETASEMLKSNSFRHTLVGAAIICGLLFLFFFFKSTSLGSGSHERGKRRRETEQNYYEDYDGDDGYGGDDGSGDDEGHRGHRSHRRQRDRRRHRSRRGRRGYEEEPPAYGSEPSVAPSKASDMNLSYQPRRDSYY